MWGRLLSNGKVGARGNQSGDAEKMKRILFVVANPEGASSLGLPRELREVLESLKPAERRREFEIRICPEARFKDIRRHLLDLHPHIVHFSGHGSINGIVLNNEQNRPDAAEGKTLAELFALVGGIECVVLNACYSDQQAKAIASKVPCVVGVNAKASDEAAIEFSRAFYDFIGADEPYEKAVEAGANAAKRKDSAFSIAFFQRGKGTVNAQSAAKGIAGASPNEAPEVSKAEGISIPLQPSVQMPSHARNALETFLADSPFERNVFIMMRYLDNPRFEAIEKTIRRTLEEYGLKGRMAKDRAYADDLWDNVCVYMMGCKYGIAVFEEMEERSFNPNIALEIGFMYALGRRCLLLKDKRVLSMPSDIVGKLYKPFDVFNIEESIGGKVREWIEKDLRIIPIARRISHRRFTVGISGSSQSPEVASMCRSIGTGLVALGVSLVTGGGPSVGMAALEAALNASDRLEKNRRGDLAILVQRIRPGKRVVPASAKIVHAGSVEELREILIESSDIVVFIGGGSGTWEEYKVALHKGKPILPIGAAGGTAAAIYSRSSRPRFVTPEQWERLGDQKAAGQRLVEIVLDVVRQYREAAKRPTPGKE